jgi:hypothetical protein
MICHLCKKEEGSTFYGKGKYRYEICRKCATERYLKQREIVLKWHKENKEKMAIIRKRYNDTNRKNNIGFQDSVRRKVYKAILRGKIIRGNCSVCGKEKAEAHHEDYTKPFEIVWFCSWHHRRYEEENGLRKKKYS